MNIDRDRLSSAEKGLISPSSRVLAVVLTIFALTGSFAPGAFAMGAANPAPAADASSTPTSFGPKIIAYARSHIGTSAPPNTCEVFAEEAMNAAGVNVPKLPSPNDSGGQDGLWTWFEKNWQGHAACAPQKWDASKVTAGDIVIWAKDKIGSCSSEYGHVGIYGGDGNIIENAAKGSITDDKPVSYPCSTEPLGYIPMTSCNGGSAAPQTASNDPGASPNAAVPSQSPSTSTPSSSSPSSDMSDMMSQMMPMMMMMQMMSMMSQMNARNQGASNQGSSGQGSSGQGSQGSGMGFPNTGSNTGANTGTGSSGNGSSNGMANNGSGFSGSGLGGTGTGTSNNGSGNGSGASNGGGTASSGGVGSAVSSLVNQLISALSSVFNGTAATTADGASGGSGSSSSTVASATTAPSVVLQRLEQLEQEQQAVLASQTANSGVSPSAAVVSQADEATVATTNNQSAASFADPGQDWHTGGEGRHRADRRLSCAYFAGSNAAGCRHDPAEASP